MLASARALHLPSIEVQGFCMYLRILDPWVLGSGSAGKGVRMQVSKGRVETKLREGQVESTRQGRVDIQIAGTYMTQGTL